MINHMIVGLGPHTAVAVQMDNNTSEEDINEYMVKWGWSNYSVINDSRVVDHVTGTIATLYIISDPLFETEHKMHAFYTDPENN